jgi:hypothetical protein
LFVASQVLLRAQTADILVSQGRAFLAAHDLTNANARFASALAAAPNHSTANVFRAATRLLTLADQPAGKAFLDRLLVAPTNRSPYSWTAELARDTNGTPIAPTNVSAAFLTAFLRTNMLPESLAAGTNLALVTDTNFTLALSSNETTTADVTLDYGDLLLLRASLRFAQYVSYTIYSWNIDVQLTVLRALTLDHTSAETFLRQYPNLFTFATTNDLIAARQTFTDGAALYFSASDWIRNRPTNVTRLFNFDGGSAEKEARFRGLLTDLNQSLNGPVVLTSNTNLTVNFGRQFTGARSLRSFFPLLACSSSRRPIGLHCSTRPG